MTAPDLRPSDDPSAAATMETGPEHQLAQLQEPETLAKVLPADAGPLVSSWWTCGICGYSKPGGPPSGCFAEANLLPPDLVVDGCPLGKPAT